MRIFILGNGHSGSSMLGMILGSHPSMTNIGEAYNSEQEFITHAKARLIKKNGLCGVCGKDCDFWGSQNKDLFRETVCVDTSKIVAWARKFSNAGNKYIRITRSVFDRLGSFKRQKGHISREIVENWVRHEKEVSDYLSEIKFPSYTIKYEDLCRKHGLEELMKYIGFEYIPDMWDFWKTMHHPIRGNHRTNLLVKLYHGKIKENELSKKDQEFMKNIGFSITYWNRSIFLGNGDLKLIRKYGGYNMNRRIGYNG